MASHLQLSTIVALVEFERLGRHDLADFADGDNIVIDNRRNAI